MRSDGINLQTQDYLALSRHPDVLEAARLAIEVHGVQPLATAGRIDWPRPLRALESRLAAFLGLKGAALYSSRWSAALSAIGTLVWPDDHVIVDAGTHRGLVEAARVATDRVHVVPHLSIDAVEDRLRAIRGRDARNGVVVATHGLFPFDSSSPDLPQLHKLCREFDALLLVDVTHDLGALGATGRGQLEAMQLVGQADVVVGGFAPLFASNGGFVATNNPALQLALRFHCAARPATATISPVQAIVVLLCLSIVQSRDGALRRARLLRNAIELRRRLAASGFAIPGVPSPIVPVDLGEPGRGRLMTQRALESGVRVELVGVAERARWRCHLSPDLAPQELARFVEVAVEAREEAGRLPLAA